MVNRGGLNMDDARYYAMIEEDWLKDQQDEEENERLNAIEREQKKSA